MRKATNKNWQRVTAAAAALALCAGVLTGCGASSSTAASSTAANTTATTATAAITFFLKFVFTFNLSIPFNDYSTIRVSILHYY